MAKDSGVDPSELRVDGGASVNNLLMQIQSNAINKKVVRPVITETTALGAAYLAGLAIGFWNNVEEINSQWQEDKIFEPEVNSVDFSEVIKNWNKALERSKGWYESKEQRAKSKE